MRVCNSFSERRNVQYNRVTCPQQVSNAPFGGATGRQRVSPSHHRLEEAAEGRSVENGHSGTQRGNVKQLFRMDVPEVLSDSSGHSLESVHVVFGDFEESFGEPMEEEVLFQPIQRHSAAVPIPAPGQLTQAFQSMTQSPKQSVARSAPVPVPGRGFQRSSFQNCTYESDSFIPPHVWTDRYQDPLKRERLGGLRGLSSLRARNAVLAQLGFIDGFEMHQPSASHVSLNT